MDKNIHVKNVREESWERFKQELFRINGTSHPGLGKALSDALDYYRINVLEARSRKEWGGGVKKKVFKQKEKLNLLINSLIKDLEAVHPKFWKVSIDFDIELQSKIVRYEMNEKQIKHAIRSILEITDRHTIRSYIESLEMKNFIYWEKGKQKWILSGIYSLRSDGYPELARIRKLREKMKGSVENTLTVQKKAQTVGKIGKITQDLPIIIEPETVKT